MTTKGGMAHRLYDADRTMLIAGTAMDAARAQTARMLDGAVALRAATAHAAAARQGREEAEGRRDVALQGLALAQDHLRRARAARAAFAIA